MHNNLKFDLVSLINDDDSKDKIHISTMIPKCDINCNMDFSLKSSNLEKSRFTLICPISELRNDKDEEIISSISSIRNSIKTNPKTLKPLNLFEKEEKEEEDNCFNVIKTSNHTNNVAMTPPYISTPEQKMINHLDECCYDSDNSYDSFSNRELNLNKNFLLPPPKLHVCDTSLYSGKIRAGFDDERPKKQARIDGDTKGDIISSNFFNPINSFIKIDYNSVTSESNSIENDSNELNNKLSIDINADIVQKLRENLSESIIKQFQEDVLHSDDVTSRKRLCWSPTSIF
jgi:hypothetical protein